MKGDIIEVDDEGLRILDDFEEHPDWYERMQTEVKALTGKLFSSLSLRNYNASIL